MHPWRFFHPETMSFREDEPGKLYSLEEVESALMRCRIYYESEIEYLVDEETGEETDTPEFVTVTLYGMEPVYHVVTDFTLELANVNNHRYCVRVWDYEKGDTIPVLLSEVLMWYNEHQYDVDGEWVERYGDEELPFN